MADTNITMTTAGGVRLETEGTYVDTDIVVAPDSTSQANLIPENIRSGVSILNVDGTLNPQDGLSMYTTTSTLATSGTGTIAATAINLPTGRTLQVDDLLVDTAGTVVRVTAVGTNVSYTYYASYRGPAGTNGTDGTDGEDGLSMYPVSTALVTSGTGSVPLSNITLPEFRSIQIGDLLLGTNGVVGRVTSTGSTVSYTAFTDIHGENGEDGADGSPGANGRPALTCNGLNIDTSGEAPEVGQSYTTGLAALNQTPVIGDKFMTVLNTATDTYPDGGSYLCGCTVTAVNGDLGTIGATFTFSIQTVNSITGQRGPAGQGVPSGGTTGQVLKKASNTNYDTEWADESGGGGGDTVIDLGILTFTDGVFHGTITQEVFNSISAGSKVVFLTTGLIGGGCIVSSLGDPAEIFYGDLLVYYNGAVTAYCLVISSDLNVNVYQRPAITSYVDEVSIGNAFSTVSNIVTTTADSPDASSLPEGTLVIKIAS